ncbi:hypothetical protein T03_11149 [Trichinella britovi]|uniref:Uncharacterized protein n=1 Tax=Trichinella britovi TaxID=45882 RepID=A0A0V1CSH4_TRIBR|nr:hypothetical protein T03_11149 [Trichinella britovi]
MGSVKQEACLRLLYYKNELHTAGFISFSIALIKIATFWKVSRQTNAYMSNKWPLKLSGAYLNTQGSSPSGTPLKWIDNG